MSQRAGTTTEQLSFDALWSTGSLFISTPTATPPVRGPLIAESSEVVEELEFVVARSPHNQRTETGARRACALGHSWSAVPGRGWGAGNSTCPLCQLPGVAVNAQGIH